MMRPTSSSTWSTSIRPRTARRRCKRFEAGELDSNDDLPTEQLDDPARRSSATRSRSAPYLGTYYYAIEDGTRSRGQRRASPGDLDGDRPRLPGREGLGELHDPGLRHGAPGHRGLHVRRRPTTPTMSQLDREDKAKEILTEARLRRRRQAAQDGDPLQHVGEPQEHGGRHPGAAEAARHRGDAARTPTPRRTTPISRQKGDFDVARAGWIADYKDPESFLGISSRPQAATTTRTTTTRSSTS